MSTVTVSEKGQIVIPAELRRQLGIGPGTRLEVVAETGGFRVIIDPQRKGRSAADCLGVAGYSGRRVRTEELGGAEAARRLAKRGAL
ncbi:MAG TPA: AbrB/MazE/SpoVT family DNA-binding domain-containing protein [Candidatus Binatia bacterium]|nr:AbrB/MazE/SpoVT family DNA-binding domain-containing protein [Candidatus Binatia bacterium]